jgi:hypothetical protein
MIRMHPCSSPEPGDCSARFELAVTTFWPLDVLFNAAGRPVGATT